MHASCRKDVTTTRVTLQSTSHLPYKSLELEQLPKVQRDAAHTTQSSKRTVPAT